MSVGRVEVATTLSKIKHFFRYKVAMLELNKMFNFISLCKVLDMPKNCKRCRRFTHALKRLRCNIRHRVLTVNVMYISTGCVHAALYPRAVSVQHCIHGLCPRAALYPRAVSVQHCIHGLSQCSTVSTGCVRAALYPRAALCPCSTVSTGCVRAALYPRAVSVQHCIHGLCPCSTVRRSSGHIRFRGLAKLNTVLRTGVLEIRTEYN